MGRLWSMVLPLLFCCWGLGTPESSAGHRTSPPGPLMPANGTEVLAVTPGVGCCSETDSQPHSPTEMASAGQPSPQAPTLSTQTSAQATGPASTAPEAEARDAENVSTPPRSKALRKNTPSAFSGVSTPSMETPAARSSPLKTVPSSKSLEAAFHVLCTEESSEEVQISPAPISAEAQGNSVSSESGIPTAPDGVPTTPDAHPPNAPPDLSAPARARGHSTVIHEVMTHCDIIEVEAMAPQNIPPSDPSTPEGREAWSAPETSALPESHEAKSQSPRTNTSAENESTATATPATATAARARAGTAGQAPPLGGTLAVLSTSPLEEATDSGDTLSLTGVSGAVGFPTGAGSAGFKATTPAGPSATSVSGLEVGDTFPGSSPPRNSSPDSIPVDRSPLTATPSSTGPASTLTKSTVPANPWGPDGAAGGQPSTAAPTSASRKLTPGVSLGEDTGFLLLRLSVVSWEDLLDPRVVERLMQQLRCELHTHMPLTQVSLLRVTRS